MAGTVESSIVLNAVDNTKSALNSVQSNLEKLVHKAVEVSNGFSKISTEGMSGFQLQAVKATNEVNKLSSALSECTEGTQEYAVIQARLNTAIEKRNQLFEESTVRTQQDIQAQIDEYNAIQNTTTAEEKNVSVLQRMGDFIVENTKKLFSHKEKIMSNSEAIKYREEQIKRVGKELAQAEQQLATMENKVGTSSSEIQAQKEYVRELEQQLKEYKKELKDTTAHLSPFQLALQKLGKNIKSLFLLHAAKGILDTMRKSFKWAVDEMIQGGMKLEAVVHNFDHLAEVGGMDAIKLRNALREASHNMISDADLMTSANKAMMLGVGGNVENLSKLMKIAEVRGAQMGETTTKAFNDMVVGIGRLSPKILDNLGIIINLNDAYDTYAQKVGKATDELTKQEQQTAVTEEVIRKSADQLLNRENRNLSVQEKLTQIVTKVKNALDTVGAEFMVWLSPVIDKINELATNILKKSDDIATDIQAKSSKIPTEIAKGVEEIWRVCETLVTDMYDRRQFIYNDILSPLWDNIETLIGWIGDGATYLGGLISSIFGDVGEDGNEVITGFAGDWTDLLYIIRQGLEGIYTATKVVLKGIVGLVKALGSNIGTIVGYIPTFFSAAWKGVKLAAQSALQGVLDTVYDWVNGTIKGINNVLEFFGLADKTFSDFEAPKLFDDLDDQADSLLNKVKEFEGIGEQLAEPRKEARSDVNAEMDAGVSRMLDNYLERVGDITKRQYALTNKRKPRKFIEDDDDDGGGGGGGGKEDEMSKEMKELIKQMEEYAKETSKIKEKNMDNIVASMEECVKSAEKLAKEVAKLQEELDKLGGEEREDIAEQYVKAEDKLKDLEEQYTNIREAVEDLGEAYIKNGMGRDEEWGDIDRNTLREYIDLQAQLKSAYEGLNEEGIKLLDEQIQKQKEYNELNDIEKIKFDYAEKRKALEEDIAEKQALIQKELQEYDRLKDEKIAYEKEWLNYMNWSVTKQMEWQQKLIDQAERLLEVRREAGLAGSGGAGHRAGGGVVYGGESYIVGEHGPELFTPNVSGKITPNNQITNNNGIEIHLEGITVRSDNDIQAIVDEIVRRVKLEKNFGIN